MRSATTSTDVTQEAPGTLLLLPPMPPTTIPDTVSRSAEPTVKLATEREEILAVLSLAASDPGYIAQLTYDPGQALEGYALSQAARGALACGDVRWIEDRVGKLDARLRTWLDCRLQQEIW